MKNDTAPSRATAPPRSSRALGKHKPQRSTHDAPPLASLIEHIALTSVRQYEGNPRIHGDRQIVKLASIIRSVGFLVPIMIDGTNTIIAGHGRLEAAKYLGLQIIPVIRVGHLAPHEIKAFRLADNRIGELSKWDGPALAVELKAIAATIDMDPEILELTAFEASEIDLSIHSLDEQPSGPDKADLLPDAGPAVSRLGDLWALGGHRLFCGSSLVHDSYDQALQERRVRAVWSDPPYNLKVSAIGGLGSVQHREFAMASGEMSEVEFTAFLAAYLALAKRYSLAGALHYVCMDGPHTYELLSAARQVELRPKVICTWAKTNAGMGSFYRQQTEFVHVFKNGGDEVPHLNNIQLGKYGRYRTTLWTYPGVNTFRKGRMADLQAHPTVKPWALVADAIKDCTRIGDAVLDCFCGSGTTLIAAEKTGRIGYGIEIDPVYVDVAIRRWEALTGKDAVHTGTGQTFAVMQAESLSQPMAASRRGGGGHDTVS